MDVKNCEVNINRRGINSVDVVPSIEVAPGDDLVLKLINHGSAIHLTLSSSNSMKYTDFFHDNLYLPDIVEYRIPILDIAPAGSFSVDIITGYGVNKKSLNVVVVMPEETFVSTDEEFEPETKPKNKSGEESEFPWLIAVILIIASLGFGANIVYQNIYLNIATFVFLVAGVIVGWLYQR
ncbi:MAG: hypothetical protein U9N40_00030 [Euryarchaeota archaeon]|nr:hypothetical protein [Euryarchaeota archaeon]